MDNIEIEGLTNVEILKLINETFDTNYTSSNTSDLLDALCEVWNKDLQPDNSHTVDQLKKQIKYAKNPLEIRQLNKQLNDLYKNRKKN